MRKFLLLLTACCAFFLAELNAQQFSKGYLDSVKSFYMDWSAHRKDFMNPFILDNTSYPRITDQCIFMIYGNNLDKNPTTVYKKVIDSSLEKGYYYSDSVTFTTREIQLLLLKLEQSKSFTWAQDYFPTAKIMDTSQFFRAYRNTPNNVPKPSGWVFSLPVFLRNGVFSINYYMYYCPNNCTKQGILVYKNEDGHWQPYGNIFNRDL